MNDHRPQAAYPTRVAPELSSVTVTVPAAASTTLDTARLIALVPDMGGEGGERIILERIMAQGCLPTDLTITVDGLDAASLRVPLAPDLQADLRVVGEGSKGVQITIRNLRQAAVPLTFWYRGRVSGAAAGALAASKVTTLPGATITTPLPDVGGRPPYYDRAATTQQSTYANASIAVHADTERWTYTVPVGRKALFESAFVSAIQQTAAAAAGWAAIRIRIATITFLQADLVTGVTVGERAALTMGPVGYLPPGTVVDCRSFDLKADGTTILRGVARLTLFDF